MSLSCSDSCSSFQSTSVITDGRSSPAPFRCATYPLFQSTSVITDGRSRLPATSTGTFSGFNPRPSSLTDEAVVATQGVPYPVFQSTSVITYGRSQHYL